MTTEASVVFVIVVGLRFILPLFIPKWPLPAILACLVLDGIDQTIFQTFGFDPPGYQNYDKAMDLFYLSIAFLASLQNWTRSSAVGISRFLFFYRMVGVMLFEITGVRALLLVFPNTFEYFFIAYEAVRLRWDPRRFTTRFWILTAAAHLDLRQAAAGVLDPRRPARLHRHLAGRAVVRPAGVDAVLVGLALLWFVVRPRLMPPDWSWHVAADPLPAEMDTAAERDAWTAAHVRVRSRSTLEKVVLIGLLSTIYARILPGLEVSDLRMFVGIAVFVVINAAISIAFARRAGTPSRAWPGTSRCASSSTSCWCCSPGSSSAPGRSTSRPRSSSCCWSRCSSPCTTGTRRSRRCAPSTTAPTPSRLRAWPPTFPENGLRRDFPRRHRDDAELPPGRGNFRAIQELQGRHRYGAPCAAQIWAVASWPSSSGACRSIGHHRAPPRWRADRARRPCRPPAPPTGRLPSRTSGSPRRRPGG